MDNLDTGLFVRMNIIVIFRQIIIVNLDSTDGTIKSIDPQQHFIHRVVRQTIDSFVIISYFCGEKNKDKRSNKRFLMKNKKELLSTISLTGDSWSRSTLNMWP
jgi:membrane-bound acyltransferase YfiQ involved in biofilm formation